MSDPSQPQPSYAARIEDRAMPAVIYALYLVGIFNGLTALIGLVLAYANVGTAGPKNWSHYVFQIRTFWTCVAWMLVGGGVVAIGGVLMVVLIGFPIFHLGLAIIGLSGVWFFVRSAVGAVYLAQDQAYPRPRTWFL
jgi:uncharacterized membrane protein